MFDLLFINSSWILSSLEIVLPSILLCLGILCLVRKMIPRHVLQKNHDVAGFTFSIIGVLYSVILGFTVINVQERYNEVLQTIHTEAILVADLYRDAGFFPKEGRNDVRANLRQYVNYVVEKEWNRPVEKKIYPETQDILEQIWNSYYKIDLKNEKMTIWYTESIAKLNNFLNARLTRQFNSWEHLGDMMWTLLFVGAGITICFMLFFGLENLYSQMLMMALLSGYLSFMLFLIYSLDNVFKGPIGVKPVAFEQIIPLFDRWDQNG